MRPVSLFLCLAAAMFLAPAPRAQCGVLANTGCANQQGGVSCSQAPRIGTTLSVVSAGCLLTQVPLVLLGTVAVTSIPIPPLTSCNLPPCAIGCTPLLFMVGSQPLAIPNDPGLVGTSLCAQPTCLDVVNPTPRCHVIRSALQITIQP